MATLNYRDPTTGQWTNLDLGVHDHGEYPDNASGDPHPQYMTESETNSAYVNRTGDTITAGTTKISSGVILRNNGAAQNVRLRPITGVSGLAIMQDDTTYTRLQTADPVDNTHAVTHGWLANGPLGVRISGPHQGNATSHPYMTLPLQSWTPMANGFVRIAAHSTWGRYRLSGMCTIAITSATEVHNTVYVGMMARWGDGSGAGWRNNCPIAETRFTTYSNSGLGYFRGWVEGWIEHRPGQALTFGLAGYRNTSGCTAQIGNFYRLTAEFYPETTIDAGLNSGWVNYA